jgi:dipeptidyl aminopeptidase/acylaminoacyl peptidase
VIRVRANGSLRGRHWALPLALASSTLTIGLVSLVAASVQAGDVAASANTWVDRGVRVSRQALEVPMIGGEFGGGGALTVSPDRIAYVRSDYNVETNSRNESLWIVNTKSDAKSTRLDQWVRGATNFASIAPKFSPDGQFIAYLTNRDRATGPQSRWYQPGAAAIEIQSIPSERRELLDLSGIPANTLGQGVIPSGILSFAWSPDGRRLAALISGTLSDGPERGIEASVSGLPSFTAAPARILEYDLQSAGWRVISPVGINVEDFDWSPDGTRIVYAGSVGHLDNKPYMFNDLYVTSLSSAETRKIWSEPGRNCSPVWSPDGRWIAFQSQHGQVRWLGDARIGLYDTVSEQVTYPAFEALGQISGFGVRGIHWAPNSHEVLIHVPYRLSEQLFKLSIPDGMLSRFTTIDDANFYAADYSRDGRTITYISESFSRPPKIYRSPSKRYQPTALHDDDTNSLSAERIEARIVSWPSTDGKWTVHGWLLLPKHRERDAGPMPLLVYAAGGPDMVSPEFRSGGRQYPVHAFLAAGVAVFIPNTRGRAGYGADFQRAWEIEHDCGTGPLSDLLAGVDMLVAERIVDPERMALAGHSWGGYLAAYALMHTARFKTVLVHEAASLDAMAGALAIVGDPVGRQFAHQLGTFDDPGPYDQAEAARLRSMSPIYQVQNATTPSLLEFGGAGSLIQEAVPLYQGLKFFNRAPTELVSYPRSRHVTLEPRLQLDAAQRDLEWIGYWVLGKPTQRMLDRYGPPQISEWNPAAGARAEAPTLISPFHAEKASD